MKIYIEPQGKSYPYNTPRTESDGSLPTPPEISSKIKAIDKNKANAEIEKGEIVLDEKTGTLHKALGKPHSKGGTPVSLNNSNFIFANYKPLAINNQEKEIFEFKI